jgi:REP element-mobilizing transposase RayT
MANDNFNPIRHHRRSIRFQDYDYSKEGLYFITICVKDRQYLFGEIQDGIMILNDMGKIADECWVVIPKHFPNVILHEHIVMPDHVHGIVELKYAGGIRNEIGTRVVGTRHVVSLHQSETIDNMRYNQFSKPIPGSIPVIIQQYKSSVTRIVKKSNILDFKWQSRFYEHIIRDEQSFQRIVDYITGNPKNWQKDNKFDYRT